MLCSENVHRQRRQFCIAMISVGIILCVIICGTTAHADDAAPINYDDHIAKIFQRNCLKCHGEGEKKAGLDLSSHASILKGGSAGTVVVAGRSSASLLVDAITNEDPDARMPPNTDPLPAEQIKLIIAWIDQGLRQSAGSTVAATRSLGFVPSSIESIATGPPPMPEGWPVVDHVKTIRPFPVIAMAASPRASLVAVSRQDSIEVVDPVSRASIGVLPFAEGEPHVLRFSRSGALLLSAGGRPVQSGAAVLYDVRSGKRLASFGEEIDTVIAADLSADERLVAIGGSGRVVKAFSTVDGQLAWKITKHTDWVTAVAFSPDGERLATADRAGGIHLWDVHGGLLLSLSEHKAAVRGLAWRADSRVLASCGDDGLIVWWNATDGWPVITKANAHPPQRPAGVYGKLPMGVYDVAFGPNGGLASCGRDGMVRLWADDGRELRALPVPASQSNPSGPGALLTRVALTHDGARIVAGDSAGRLHSWD